MRFVDGSRVECLNIFRRLCIFAHLKLYDEADIVCIAIWNYPGCLRKKHGEHHDR